MDELKIRIGRRRSAAELAKRHIGHDKTKGESMREDIVPVATFPDYELPDQESVSQRLSEIQGDAPLILPWASSPRQS